MQKRVNFPMWACTDRGFLAKCKKEFKHIALLESKGKFIMEVVMLHKQHDLLSKGQSDRV